MKTPALPNRFSQESSGPLRRVFLLGAALFAVVTSASAAVTDISNALFPAEANPANGIRVDSAIGAGNTGRLVGVTQTFWAEGFSLPVDLNENTLILGTGGNGRNYYGAISGNGELRTINGGQNRIGGSVGNTYTGTTNVNSGCVYLEKTSGNALCGTITVKGSLATPVVWVRSNQISDTSNVILSNTGALNLAGYTDTINDLYLVTGTQVQTGALGVLKVARLFINGTQQPEVAKGVDGVYVTGSGWIEVGASGPLVVTSPPAAPATPVPASATSTINPAYLSKLDWGDCTDASSYDVYLWLASAGARPASAIANVSTSEYTVNPQVVSLENYKWQIVAKNTVGNTEGPVWTFTTIDRKDLSGTLALSLDAVVGAGPARLIADATTNGGGGTMASNVNLNGFRFTINNGGGNASYYNGAITGPGTLRTQGRGDATWSPDIQLSGTVANSMSAVSVDYGHLQLNKTDGVDALAGPITVNTTYTVRIHLSKSNQINDASTITSTAGSGSFYLEMNGFSDTILGLDIKTGHQVETGTGGVLTVTNLTVGGVVKGPGTYTSSNSTFVTGTGSVVVPGATTPADAGRSTVEASPGSVVADGVATSTITVTLLDATGAVVPGKAVTLASNRAAGLDTITPASGESNASGVVTFTVKSTTPGDAIFTATDTTDSIAITATATVTYTAIPPADAGLSTVVASPTTLCADGVHASTVIVTLLNASSLPVAGKTVALASDRAAGTDTITTASAVSNASGVVTFTVKSTTPGDAVLTATDTTDTITVSVPATVTFTENPAASAGSSTVSAAPSSVVANGSSASTITVTLLDGSDLPLAGKTVTLASSRAAGLDTISGASGVSNISGVVTFTVTSSTVGTPEFTATDVTDGVTLTSTTTVSFTAPSNVVDISNTLYPFEPTNTGAGVKIDVAVASGYSGRLVDTTKTHWASGGFSRALDLNGNSLIIDSGGGNTMVASGAISGNGSLTVNAGGIGILHISGAVGNTYTGTTEINNGPVKLGKTSGNALNGTITVKGTMSNSFPGTGTLLWGANNQINDASNLTLTVGSSLNFNSYSETLGTLAITGDSNIYLTGSTSIAHFADSSAAAWTSAKQLIIREWNGSLTGGGTESVFFGTSASGLSADQVAHIGFMNPTGFAAGLYPAAMLASGEVVPTGTAVVPVSPPYDLSAEATAARTALYTSTGRADLTAAGTPLSTGTRIVLFGDSITWQNTYIGMINAAIASGAGTQGKTITLINRGINGGGVADIRDGAAGSGYPGNTPQASFASLLDSDQADIAVVYIGINDAGWRNTTPAAYEQGLRDLAATAAAKGVTLILATPAANGESPIGAGGIDPQIDAFSAIVQKVSTDTGATFVNLRQAFVNYWKNNNYEIRLDGGYAVLKAYGLLTYDGIHPTTLGNQMIADEISDGILAALTTGTDTTTAVATSAASVTVGTAVTFTATVTPLPTGGSVEFREDGTPIGSGGVTVNTDTGIATLEVSNLPVGTHVITAIYSGDATYKTSTGTLSGGQVVLTKFNGWAVDKGLVTGNKGPNDDPDGDGVNNLTEFAFGGNPKDAADSGKIYSLTAVPSSRGPGKELILTLAVRSGTPDPWAGPTEMIDGITYTIEGSSNLTFPNGNVIPVSQYVTGAMSSALTDPDYEYRSFVLENSSGLPTQGFLRAKVEQ